MSCLSIASPVVTSRSHACRTAAKPRLCVSAADSRTRDRSCGRRAGFTLLELLLVLAILVVIGGIVGANIIGAQSDANINATQAQLNSLKSNVVYFKLRTNSLPDDLQQLKDGPSDADKKAKWVDSIIEEVPVDAWGNDFDFTSKGNTFEIRSGGLDGQMNTEDDIVVEGR